MSEELIESIITTEPQQRVENYKWLSERAILAAKNKDVDDLNCVIQNQVVGTLNSFKSTHWVTNKDAVTNNPSEFLYYLDVPTFTHNLHLEMASVVLMLWNLNHPKLPYAMERVWW